MKLPESIRKQIAPNVEPFWADALLVELRLRGVAGERIGAVLAEVESHCAESGESATEIFGDPIAYADSLNLPVDPRQEPAAIGRTVAPIMAQVIGLFLLFAGLPALKQGVPVGVQLGEVLWLVLFLGLAASLVLAAGPILRALLSRPILGVLAGALLMVLLVVPTMMAPGVIAQLPAWLVVGIAVLLLAGGALAGGLDARKEPADEITSPLPGSPASKPRSSWLPGVIVPAIALVAGIALWFWG
ncbi:MAG TPA: hypothetical protein PKV13_10580 [Propionicimonas sp.]|nr:hypothetical protein [Propionicimonas sp.]HRA07048.1 hypothetical protein [Propionicimonas sp.]